MPRNDSTSSKDKSRGLLRDIESVILSNKDNFIDSMSPYHDEPIKDILKVFVGGDECVLRVILLGGNLAYVSLPTSMVLFWLNKAQQNDPTNPKPPPPEDRRKGKGRGRNKIVSSKRTGFSMNIYGTKEDE